MKYCCDFQKQLSCLSKLDEITIKYNESNTHIENFIQEHPNQKINILIQEDTEKLFIKNNELDIVKKYDLTLKLQINCSKIFIKTLQDNNIKFFLDWYAVDWDEIYFLLTYNVSEMYIGEALGFDLERVSKFLHSKNIKIRTNPNVCQAKRPDIIPSLKTFFIRPEDVYLYEKFIDVLEFWGDKPDVYFDIYKNDKEWYGDLSEIIIDLDVGYDSRFILPTFAEKRAVCDRKCLKGETCLICDRIIELSQTLKEAGLKISIKEEIE